jgi:hypothetical protein
MNRVDSDAVRAAVAEFPDLIHLVNLVAADWIFATVAQDGEVTHVQGVRAWPDYWTDAIGVRYTTDAQGLRADPTGHVVWKREGSLAEVVSALLELPAPSTGNAPRLAIGSAPRLWTPGR